MKIAIIDDEEDARVVLRSLLLALDSKLVINEADSVASGITLIKRQQPDLVFLDIMMTDGTGFDLLSQLPSPVFKLVIVSGHEEFALKAFRFSAIDYLIKPVDADELQAAFSRIRSSHPYPWQNIMDALKQNFQQSGDMDRKIVLKDLNSVYVVSVKSIVRCESSDNYTTFYLTDRQPILVSRPLREYDDLLVSFRFIRVHQSHLINLDHLQQFDKREGGIIKMKDSSEVPVSSRKRDALLAALSSLHL